MKTVNTPLPRLPSMVLLNVSISLKFPDSSSTKANPVADLQKKMKVLRDALIKEKQEKEILSKAKAALEKENERVKSQFQEKVSNSLDCHFLT